MTGTAPADETAAAPTIAPPTPSQFAGEGAERYGDGTLQIAYLHSGQVSHSWHQSLINAIAYDKSLGLNLIAHAPFAVACSGPNSLPEGRNLAVSHFLDETESSWLMFIDTDMGFEADAIERLLVAADPVERPVVGGLCFALKHMKADGKGGFHVQPVPTLYMKAKNEHGHVGFANRFIYPPDALVQVAGTGAAFILIHRSVLVEIRDLVGDTWFDFVQYEDGTSVSEDLSFCYRVGAANWPVYVHTGVKTTHHKQFWLGEDGYRMPQTEPAQKLIDDAAPEPVREKLVEESPEWQE